MSETESKIISTTVVSQKNGSKQSFCFDVLYNESIK